jgi:hypothetical protein
MPSDKSTPKNLWISNEGKSIFSGSVPTTKDDLLAADNLQ